MKRSRAKKPEKYRAYQRAYMRAYRKRLPLPTSRLENHFHRSFPQAPRAEWQAQDQDERRGVVKHTDATIERIREMTAAGDSMSVIAAMLGFTRSQVSGIRARAGIQSGTALRRIGRKSVKRRAIMPIIQPMIEVVDDHEPPSRRFSINQLTHVTCRWPHGDPKSASFNYCGHDTKPNSSYC